ncbi:chemotaxis protein CheA [Asticcacaulis benevestitus]|uniref:Chemotaxis protein CheA n=1 Tax=Asticcacaulis benevestitus DSM 16100 = ATCC BAA-896 TaxID=1121022 RepID=V4RN09_9CAUL|nr:chemotaxis protein CheA [Asticcacaulis benevestitus]ESQ92628.1 hypothetical protein ABENE_07360 [Asticcacaulis benevestitus DSM 16100 = ATCC BAA-896]
MKSLLARFIPEARDLIESSSSGLLKLEKTPNDISVVNEVFRAVHTLKGSSGLFDVPALTRLVHVAEDLLGAVRAEELNIDPQLVDHLLSTLDQVGVWINHLETEATLPEDADRISQSMSTVLKQAFSKSGETAVDGKSGADAEPEFRRLAASALDGCDPDDRFEAFAQLVSGLSVQCVEYQPADDCFFNGTDPLAMMLSLPGLISLTAFPVASFAAITELDPYRCNLRFQALSVAPKSDIEHHLRYELDHVVLTEVYAEDLIVVSGLPSDLAVFGDFYNEAVELLARDAFAQIARSAKALGAVTGPDLASTKALLWLASALEASTPDKSLVAALIEAVLTGTFRRPQVHATPAVPSALRRPFKRALDIISSQMRGLQEIPFEPSVLTGPKATVSNLLRSLDRDELLDSVETAGEQCVEAGSFDPFLHLLEKLVADIPSFAGAENGAPSLSKAAVEQPLKVDEADKGSAQDERDASIRADPKQAPSRILKVDQGKIDALMNLIGELVVSKNSLPFLARRAEEVHGSREMSREIKEQYAIIDRLAQEMQAAIMQVRMLPIADVFDRFPRLVRDLSRKLAKDISLVIEGGDTAADKNIIEALNDPLLHIVRNSLDHGVEPPAERVAAGKPQCATIGLKAYQEADYVVIEVNDDGRGMDPAKIRASAVKKGVITPDEAGRLSDQEAINLIFRPGFSTAEKISDLSGRGVGMDVVRTAIEKLGGRVSVTSRIGEGSNTKLMLPLSMAVTRVMIIEAASDLFGVPMDLIVETVRVETKRIHKIKQAEAFVLRDQLIPLVRMADLLSLPARPLVDDAEAVLVCRIDGRLVGLVIDDFRVGMDVIVKPLEGIVAGIPGFSGTTLLGDGRVLLVLDLKELV